jgi:hypothetical protein
MTIKTSELIGPALDWAVARAEGKKVLSGPPIRVANIHKCLAGEYEVSKPYSPTTDWAIMGPIIERENINLIWSEGYPVKATIHRGGPVWIDSFGETPLIAAARCYVTSKLGREGELPEELKIVGQKA